MFSPWYILNNEFVDVFFEVTKVFAMGFEVIEEFQKNVWL